ncbi:MAG: hypothetical protein IPK96_02320 [Flammeovirgaceae bacterium]|nr:hypothetical protein [Flammeovirgaceae bacterium]
MTQELKSIPKWILIVSGFFSLLGLIVSSTLIFSPQSALQTVDLNAKGVNYLIQMWAARQFAVGFIFGFATLKKSAPMLTIAYIFFFVMNIADTIIGFSQNDNGLIIGASIMCVIASTMLYFLNRRTK